MVTNLEYALKYISQGFAIFPCKGKSPLTKNGFKDASTSPEQIKKWWKASPEANIAIATGIKSQVEVLDIDKKSDGFNSLRKILTDIGPLPTENVVKTGGGGYHFYFHYSGRGYTNRSNILPGVDFKTEGGYVIAPPSLHESGQNYKWIEFNYQNFMKGETEC